MTNVPRVGADGKVAISDLPPAIVAGGYAPAKLKKVCVAIAPIYGMQALTEDVLYTTLGLGDAKRTPTRIDARIAAAILVEHPNFRALIHQHIYDLICGNRPANETKVVQSIAEAKQVEFTVMPKMDEPIEIPMADRMTLARVMNSTNSSELQLYKGAVVGSYIAQKIAENRDSFVKGSELINLNELVKLSDPKVRKDLYKWRTMDATTEFLSALGAKLDKPIDELLQVVHGGAGKGTWGHPYIAINIAQWLDPIFAVEVTAFVAKMMSGDLTLVTEVVDRHDAINETKTNIVSIAPGTADQVRQTAVTSIAAAGPDIDKQAALNDKMKQLNDEWLARPIDCSRQLTPAELYRDYEGTEYLNDSVPDGQYERALQVLSFGHVKSVPDRRRLEMAMWDIIVQYQHEMAKAHIRHTELVTRERKDGEEQLDKQQLREAVTYLTNQLTASRMAHDLLPYIERFASAKWLDEIDSRVNGLIARAQQLAGRDGGNIESYLNEARANMRVMAGEFSRSIGRVLEPYNPDPSTYRMTDISVINTHLTSVGLNMAPYLESKFAIDALHQVHTILRGNLATSQFCPAFVNPINMFAGEDKKEIAYYDSVLETLKAADHSLEYASFVIHFDESDDDSTEIFRPASDGIPPKQRRRTKKSNTTEAKLTVTDAVAAAKSMTPQLRAAIAAKIGDLLNCHPLIAAPITSNDIINIYIGQFGFAPFITPVHQGSSPGLYIYLTTGEFRDSSIYHLHPAGRFHLKSTDADHLLVAKLKPMLTRKPREESHIPAGFGFVTTPSWSTKLVHSQVIKAVAKILGDHVTHLSLPIDASLIKWHTFAPTEIATI